MHFSHNSVLQKFLSKLQSRRLWTPTPSFSLFPSFRFYSPHICLGPASAPDAVLHICPVLSLAPGGHVLTCRRRSVVGSLSRTFNLNPGLLSVKQLDWFTPVTLAWLVQVLLPGPFARLLFSVPADDGAATVQREKPGRPLRADGWWMIVQLLFLANPVESLIQIVPVPAASWRCGTTRLDPGPAPSADFHHSCSNSGNFESWKERSADYTASPVAAGALLLPIWGNSIYWKCNCCYWSSLGIIYTMLWENC